MSRWNFGRAIGVLVAIVTCTVIACGDGGSGGPSAGGGGSGGTSSTAGAAGAGGTGGDERCTREPTGDSSICSGSSEHFYWCEVGSASNVPGEPPFAAGCVKRAENGGIGADGQYHYQVGWCCTGDTGTGGSGGIGTGGVGGVGGSPGNGGSAGIMCPPNDCGNGVLEDCGGLEQCDDGNNIDGDGCSASCMSE